MADWAPSTTHDIKARLVRPPTRAPCNILNTSIAPYKPVPLHWKQTETNTVELQLSGFIGNDPDDQIWKGFEKQNNKKQYRCLYFNYYTTRSKNNTSLVPKI